MHHVKNRGTWKNREIIRQILENHFQGFMEIAIRSGCGTRHMGYTRKECKGCTKGVLESVFIGFFIGVGFCFSALG